MSNGGVDLKNSNTTCAWRLEPATNPGLPATPNSSASATAIMAWRRTNSLRLVSRSLSKCVSSAKPEVASDWLRSRVCSMSDERLAMLDRAGIPIIGLRYQENPLWWLS